MAIPQAKIRIREHPLFCVLFTNRTTFRFILTHPSTVKFKHRGQIIVHTLCCGQLWVWHMFWSQDLWWAIPLHIYHWSCWDTIWIPTDHMDLFQTHFPRLGSCGQIWTYGSTWVVLWLFFFFRLLPLHSLINGPTIGVRFQESLVIRLYSEIDQIHLGIQA